MTLGMVDYGIYNVVGGIVIMFSFLSNTMATASQRFFAFALGKNDFLQLRKIFSLTITIYACLAVLIFTLAETIGLWFLNTQLEIPIDRIIAANWVYQFSILSFIVQIITIPYNAAIIAHENMKVFAYVSIIEAVLKLAIVYILVIFSFDKLKLYSFLILLTTCIVTLIYRIICKRKYEDCRFYFYWDKGLFTTLASFSGWNLFGAISGVLNNQGINILLNIFFGPIVNASRAIAYQVGVYINQFVRSFITAVDPQITKYYASDEKGKMMSLVFQSSKISFFLLFILTMPLLLETHYILTLWLKQIPEYVIIFTVLILTGALIDSLSYPLMTAAQATGDIKKYQTLVGGTLLLNLPVSYCFLRLNFPPQTTLYIAIVISSICLFIRLWMLREMIDLSIREYVKKVLKSVVLVSCLALIIPCYFVFHFQESFLRFITVGMTGLITSVIAIYLFGLSMNERKYIIQIVKEKSFKRSSRSRD